MPIMMKRKDGTITPFRNAEYLSATTLFRRGFWSSAERS